MKWADPVLIRFIRLQGKNLVESVYDPTLNSIFLAWDVMVPNYAAEQWEAFRKERKKTDPAYNHRLSWQEITRRPSDTDEAWAVLYAIVDDHVSRLKELLTGHQAIEASEAEDPDWADHAAHPDVAPPPTAAPSPSLLAAQFRFRRYQSAKTRELLRTLDTLCNLRKAGIGTADAKWQRTTGKAAIR